MSWIGTNPQVVSEPPSFNVATGAEPGRAAPGSSTSSSRPRGTGDAIVGFSPSAQMPAALNGLSASDSGNGGALSGFFGLIASMFGEIQQYLAQSLGFVQPSGSVPQSGIAPTEPQASYQSADANSVGDPHESFDATTAKGLTVNGTWDDMQSHRDLLDSDSFSGGYRVATQATQPNQKGVTLNGSATVCTNGGNTTVTLDGGGAATATSYGRDATLQKGQTLALGGGETVTRNGDNSLTIHDANASGGSVTTTLALNGSGGVDVKTHAAGVDLGGYLVDRADRAADPLAYGRQPAEAPAIELPSTSQPAYAPNQSSFGSWAGTDPLGAEQNVDPLLMS
jgi:hypothetical protein